MKDLSKDPDTQAAFVHGMMFALILEANELDANAIATHLCKVWAIGDIERCAREYAEKIEMILTARPI